MPGHLFTIGTSRVGAYLGQGTYFFLRNSQMFKTKLDGRDHLFEGIMHSHRHNSWETQMKTIVFAMQHY